MERPRRSISLDTIEHKGFALSWYRKMRRPAVAVSALAAAGNAPCRTRTWTAGTTTWSSWTTSGTPSRPLSG